MFVAERPRSAGAWRSLVRPEQLYFGDARQRFQREVEAVARLSHPGIVPVYTVGEAAGVPYYAMELIEGASLAEVLARLHGRDSARLAGADLRTAVEAICAEKEFAASEAGAGEPLFAGSWADACVWLAREVAQALEHAHQRGVLHRDVKPSNILLTPAGACCWSISVWPRPGRRAHHAHRCADGSLTWRPSSYRRGRAGLCAPTCTRSASRCAAFTLAALLGRARRR